MFQKSMLVLALVSSIGCSQADTTANVQEAVNVNAPKFTLLGPKAIPMFDLFVTLKFPMKGTYDTTRTYTVNDILCTAGIPADSTPATEAIVKKCVVTLDGKITELDRNQSDKLIDGLVAMGMKSSTPPKLRTYQLKSFICESSVTQVDTRSHYTKCFVTR